MGDEGNKQGSRHAVPERKLRVDERPTLVEPEGRSTPAGLHFAIERMRGGGQPLDWKARMRMGLTLGCDFRRVRVHTCGEADRLNRQLGSQAFTTGMDIFFAQGAYDPASDAGRELIAHELIHVVQQGVAGATGGRHPLEVRPASDVFEREAEALAPFVAGNEELRTRPRVRTALATGPVLQRAMLQTVTGNTAIGNNRTWIDPNGIPPFPMATACHFATVYWLFLDEFKRVHTQAEAVKMGNAQLVVGKMIAHGTRKTNPSPASLSLTPGSILIFVENNQALHSCVAIAAQTLGGYNQGTWYSSGGVDHGYSTHPTSQLMWGDKSNRDKIHRTITTSWYTLYEVPEGPAKAVVRSAAQS